MSYVDQANFLPEMKKCGGFEWLKETPTQLLQQSLKDLEGAFKNFFHLKKGFPRYKKKGQKDSFRFPDPKQFSLEKINHKKSLVDLPKIGKIFLEEQERYQAR